MGLIINPRQIIKDGITSLRDVWSSSKVSTELSGKQATLVSGTNIKTINNTSLLGSGDITISGGGGDIPRIDMTATTATLDPNKFYVWGEVANLDISLAAETAGIENIYKFQFESGDNPTTLTLPNNVHIDGNMPNNDRSIYIITIISNIAKIDRQYRAALLPIEYQQVEYLKSSGTQYINTNINGRGDLKISTKLQGVTNSNWGFGSRLSISNSALFISNGGISGSSYGDFFFNYKNNYTYVSSVMANDGALHTYTIDSGNLIVDNVLVYSYAANDFISVIPIYLFALNDNNTKKGSYVYNFFNCTISHQGTTLADMYPCYRKADNVAGLYDIVRNVFLTNAGTGTFIVGPDV